MFELFITDLDGTLLDDEKRISEENLEAVRNLKKKGVPVSVFTGRNFYSAFKYINELQIEGLVALQNGALIIEVPSRRVINEISLEARIADALYKKTAEYDFKVLGYTRYEDTPDMYAENEFWVGLPFEKYMERNKDRLKMVDSLQTFIDERDEIGQLAVIGEEKELEAFRVEMAARFGKKISTVLSPVQNGTGFLEFFGPSVSKGYALAPILKENNTTAAKTVFIGDNYNDLPLMKKVGMPVATANAPRYIKDHCKMVVTANNNHAVKEAVETLFF